MNPKATKNDAFSQKMHGNRYLLLGNGLRNGPRLTSVTGTAAPVRCRGRCPRSPSLRALRARRARAIASSETTSGTQCLGWPAETPGACLGRSRAILRCRRGAGNRSPCIPHRVVPPWLLLVYFVPGSFLTRKAGIDSFFTSLRQVTILRLGSLVWL